ncbi:hypothetical protein ACJX0J_027908 [Zea mays]
MEYELKQTAYNKRIRVAPLLLLTIRISLAISLEIYNMCTKFTTMTKKYIALQLGDFVHNGPFKMSTVLNPKNNQVGTSVMPGRIPYLFNSIELQKLQIQVRKMTGQCFFYCSDITNINLQNNNLITGATIKAIHYYKNERYPTELSFSSVLIFQWLPKGPTIKN